MLNQITTLLLTIIVSLTLVACGGNQPVQEQAVAAESGALNLPVNIDAPTVEQIRSRDDVLLLDVREDSEYAEGHIPGAVLVPLGQIPDRLSEIPKDKTVVAVCRSGNRSNQATEFLRQQGFDNVHNMTGGMNSWSQAGYEVAK